MADGTDPRSPYLVTLARRTRGAAGASMISADRLPQQRTDRPVTARAGSAAVRTAQLAHYGRSMGIDDKLFRSGGEHTCELLPTPTWSLF